MFIVRKIIFTCLVGMAMLGTASGQEPTPTPKPIRDDFDGDGVPFQLDKPRLNRFAEELKSNKAAEGYIIAYGGLVSYKNEARIRLECIANHLKTAHGIPRSRLKLIDGGYRTEIGVKLFVVEPDDPRPEPYSLVNIEAVQMRKAPKYPCGKPAVK